MITAKLPLLLAAAASVAQGTELTGYLMDKTCATKFTGKTDIAPDGTTPFYAPEQHSGWCLLLQGCIESGYTLISEDADEDGRHSIVASFRGGESNDIVRQYIRQTQNGCGRPPCLTRSRTTPMPPVTIADAGSFETEDGILQVRGSVTLQDPWSDDNEYDGSPTTQTVCYAPSDASTEGNNMCFRSDVKVSSVDEKKVTVIQSNGCPDHANMQGGPNKAVANNQEFPTEPEGTIPNLCPPELDQSFEFDPDAVFRYKVGDGVLQGCLQVEHEGFIAFGIARPGATNAYMNGGNAIIGLPADNSVELFNLVGTVEPVRLDDAQQTLTDTSFMVEDGLTVMQFTKKLTEEGLNPILETGANVFLHARGGPTLAYHGFPNKFVITKDFSEDSGPANPVRKITQTQHKHKSMINSRLASDSPHDPNLGIAEQRRGLDQDGIGSRSLQQQLHVLDPVYQHYTLTIPQDPGTPGNPTAIGDDGVVGIMTNGVLLTSKDQLLSNEPAWSYDECNGHSNRRHQYNYYIPPICYLKSMGIPSPVNDTWWVNEADDEVQTYNQMHNQFPSTGSSPVVGFARDGFPIYALYGPEEGSPIVRSALYNGDLDECNGKGEGADYAYYITAEPPFVPTCLRGSVASRNLAFFTTDQICPAGGIKNTISGLKEVPAGPIPGPQAPPSPDNDAPAPAPAPVPEAPAGPQRDCTKEFCENQLTAGYLLKYQIIVPDGTTPDVCDGCEISMELEYTGAAWVGIAFSTDGAMIGSEAVLGLPDDNTVQKYNLAQKAVSGVTPMPGGQQTLKDTSIAFADGVTTMRFTKIMKEAGEIEISPGDNTFLWAHGSSNALGYHAGRAAFDINLSSGSSEASATPNKAAWLAHGIMAFFAWGVFVPFAVQSSLLRDLLPTGPLWFKLHRGLNSTAFAFFVVFFAIAVAYTSIEQGTHFSNSHQKMGLAMFIMAIAQVSGGVFRPHVPEEGAEKSFIRKFWEIFHRVLGVTLLACGFWQMRKGIELFAGKYSASDSGLAIAYWVWIAIMTSLIVVGGGFFKFVKNRGK